MKYKVTFDNGKPYDEEYNSDEELKDGLKKFYDLNKSGEEFAYMDAFVFNEQGDEITESQFIQEMIGEIIGEQE